MLKGIPSILPPELLKIMMAQKQALSSTLMREFRCDLHNNQLGNAEFFIYK